MADEKDGKLRVLVVDDNVDAATSLCSLLQLLGCAAVPAFDKAQALRVAAAFRPAIAILDLEMPDADGCDVLEQLRDGEDAGSGVLHVCLTGSGSTENRRRCEAAGFDHFYSKPIQAQEIAALLAEGESRRAHGTNDRTNELDAASPPRRDASTCVDMDLPAPMRARRGARPRLA